MDPNNIGQCRPPILDGSNYSYWKTRIRSFIKSIDRRAWQSVENGWSAPRAPDAQGDVNLIPSTQWTRDQVEAATFDDRAINAIYASVDMNMFKLVKNSACAKDAWDVLQRHCEGDTSIKESRLRILTTKFENMKMDEDEDISGYTKRILDIANECQDLGEPISNKVLVSKALRTLPSRFDMKVTAIETSQAVAAIEFMDLMNALKTHEMNLEEKGVINKKKVVAFTAGTTSSSRICEISELEEEEELQEIDTGDDVALITRKFNTMVRKMNKAKAQGKPKESEPQRIEYQPAKRNDITPPRPVRRVFSNESFRYDSSNIDKVQCRECKGFGHYANQCANTLRKRGKSYWVSWSDDEAEFFEDMDNTAEDVSPDVVTALHATFGKSLSDDEEDDGAVFDPISNRYGLDYYSNLLCLNACVSETDCQDACEDDAVLIIQELKKLYDELLGKWKRQGKDLEHVVNENTGLKASVAKLEVLVTQKEMELNKVTNKLEEAQGTIKKWTAGAYRFDDFLTAGNDTHGLGFSAEKTTCSNVKPADRGTFSAVKATNGKPFVKEGGMVRERRKRKRYVCHYCFVPGHIKPYCIKKRNDEMFSNMFGKQCENNIRKAKKQIWVRKDELKCNVVYTALKTNISGSWYFDSGCSRHMTGNKSFLSKYEPYDGGNVSFGGGSKGKIIGKGYLNVQGLPMLKNVFHVQGLMANLISISQLCDENLQVKFNKDSCEVYDEMNLCIMKGQRSADNCYMANEPKCNKAQVDDISLWHQRLGHTNFRNLDRLIKLEAVRGVPRLTQTNKGVCEDCQKGKQVHASHSVIQHREQHFGTTRCFELVHMDLVGPVEVESIGGKRYVYVIVDDFSRYTWTFFLREKSEAFGVFKTLFARVSNMFGVKVSRVRSDHGREFDNSSFTSFCEKKGIFQEFSAPKTPQQNGVVERKNRTLVEMARVMLSSKKLSKRFWAEAVNTACHINNRVNIRPGSLKTPYEILKGKKPNLKYLRVFGCVCYILNDREYLTKFDEKSDKGIFVGYSLNSQAYRVYNLRTRNIQESVNVVFDDLNDLAGPDKEEEVVPVEGPSKVAEQTQNSDVISDAVITPGVTASHRTEDQSDSEEEEIGVQRGEERREPPGRIRKNHPVTQIIGNVRDSIRTRGKPPVDYRKMICLSSICTSIPGFICFVSKIEPKNVKEALGDEFWVIAMHDELNQFVRNDVWYLVPRPVDRNVIGTKWIFKNKSDEYGTIVRNKARLVAQGYTQVEGVDFDDTFAPVARIESIRLLLAVACHLNIKLYQMDVKGAFLNGELKEEVYVEQPKGFEDPHKPSHVFRLKKALYGLKQAPRAWYSHLTNFLLVFGFVRGNADRTLFIKKEEHHILITQIYVDDMIVGSTSQKMLDDFAGAMSTKFEMSMVGELTFFLGLQVKQGSDGIFISQSKYAKDMVKKFQLEGAKHMRTPMGSSDKLSKDDAGEDVDPTLYRSMIGSLLYLTATRPDLMFSVCVCARYQAKPKVSHLKAVKRIIRYVAGTIDLGIFFSKDTNTSLVGFSDSDWAGDVDDRKSTSGGCFYLGNNLVSWHSRKQNCVSLSTAESEYVAAGSCCTQLLWLKQMLNDYGVKSNDMTVYCDNISAINISKNPIQHSRTKHIDIRHHFIRDLVEQEVIKLDYVKTESQIADIFTKPLDFERFTFLRRSLGLCFHKQA